MSSPHPDRRRRGLATALTAAGALLCLQSVLGAASKSEPIKLKGDNIAGNATSISMDNLDLTQGTTLLKANKAAATDLVDDNYNNATWKLSGAVHLKTTDATLDTQAATVVFADGHVKSTQTQPAGSATDPKASGTVHLEFKSAVLDSQTALVNFSEDNVSTAHTEGSPATFSHLLKNSSKRITGQARRIDYDAAKDRLYLTGDIRFFNGSVELKSESLWYNLGDGSYGSDSNSSVIFRPDERVPTPRTPDRSTAK